MKCFGCDKPLEINGNRHAGARRPCCRSKECRSKVESARHRERYAAHLTDRPLQERMEPTPLTCHGCGKEFLCTVLRTFRKQYPVHPKSPDCLAASRRKRQAARTRPPEPRAATRRPPPPPKSLPAKERVVRIPETYHNAILDNGVWAAKGTCKSCGKNTPTDVSKCFTCATKRPRVVLRRDERITA